MTRLLFIDTGVLIDAARGTTSGAEAALAVLAQSDVQFACSQLIRLETLPKARFHQRQEEVDFYEAYFAAVSVWISVSDDLVSDAIAEAARFNLSALDALHVVMAAAAGADEFVTTERPTKPIHRNQRVKVRCIQPS